MENFLGQICFFAFGRPPKGWALCDGGTLTINAYQALFSLLGTTFGGDGVSNFKLPDLRGCVPMGVSPQLKPGSRGGEETHTLTVAELPAHLHSLNADGRTPGGSNVAMPSLSTVLGITVDPGNKDALIYGSGSANGTMASQTVGNAGHGTPHENRMPYQVMSACIALQGIYPTRS